MTPVLRRTIKQLCWIISSVAALLALAWYLIYSGRLWFNLSTSIPPGVYRVDSAQSARVGQLLLTCLPEESAVMARERGYLGYGSCPGNSTPVGKKVVAGPGDVVLINESGISVNGTLLAHTRPQAHDGEGRPLPQQRLEGTLPQGEFILAAQRDDSFDSRYYGAVPQELHLGELSPVWTFSDEQ